MNSHEKLCKHLVDEDKQRCVSVLPMMHTFVTPFFFVVKQTKESNTYYGYTQCLDDLLPNTTYMCIYLNVD